MKLYNTLSKQIDELQPLAPPVVSVYTCGPTVYDYPHVGNWFTFIRYDLLVRTLKLAGYKPKWVMNITDVGHLVSDGDQGQDKLEKGAQREGKTAWEVANFYTDYFLGGLKKLNFLTPEELPKATDHITEQINLVSQLEAKGYTYVIDDGVYFDTAKFPDYAKFARLDLDEQQAGARVELNPQKRNPTDFALWKFSPADQKRDMEWDSPWGKGFPGWHLECSAMSLKYLGATIDIHSGGIDHIAVHHTNEVAQSQAATGEPLANIWMHMNHITIEGEKISKSLGNGITLEQIQERGISLAAFRLHVLESHYRSQSKFSWESLGAAQNRLKRFYAVAELRWQAQAATDTTSDLAKSLQASRADILSAAQNDLDTPQVLAIIEGQIGRLETSGLTQDSQAAFKDWLQLLDDLLGLNLLASTPDISSEQMAMIEERFQARSTQNWPEADRLRQKLTNENIGLNDVPGDTTWYRLRPDLQ